MAGRAPGDDLITVIDPTIPRSTWRTWSSRPGLPPSARPTARSSGRRTAHRTARRPVRPLGASA
jgi:hypothetical protein